MSGYKLKKNNSRHIRTCDNTTTKGIYNSASVVQVQNLTNANWTEMKP